MIVEVVVEEYLLLLLVLSLELSLLRLYAVMLLNDVLILGRIVPFPLQTYFHLILLAVYYGYKCMYCVKYLISLSGVGDLSMMLQVKRHFVWGNVQAGLPGSLFGRSRPLHAIFLFVGHGSAVFACSLPVHSLSCGLDSRLEQKKKFLIQLILF